MGYSLLTHRSVLLVADDKVTRFYARHILKLLGVGTIVEATQGKQAMELVQRQCVDIIISDWKMPTMNGLELLEAIRAHHTLNFTPFLMTMARSDVESVKQALNNGVTDVIVKPFSQVIFEEKVRRAFELLRR